MLESLGAVSGGGGGHQLGGGSSEAGGTSDGTIGAQTFNFARPMSLEPEIPLPVVLIGAGAAVAAVWILKKGGK